MTFRKLRLTNAKITNLHGQVGSDEETGKPYWILVLCIQSGAPLNGLQRIPLTGNNESEFNEQIEKFSKNLESAGIKNDTPVAVIFEPGTGDVLAVAALASIYWIDFKDDFKIKQFKDLNIIPTDLQVY